jgi:hypothetical protein
MNKFLGIALIVLALAIAVVPAFTDCQSQGKSLTTSTGKTVPMKCHWTGIAEIGVAVPLLTVGAAMTVNRRKTSLMTLGAVGIVLGGMAVAFPNGLIGVCATPTMVCHTVMKPALTVFGSLAVVGSVGLMLITRKAKD